MACILFSFLSRQLSSYALFRLLRFRIFVVRGEPVRDLGYGSEGELMGFDTVLTQFATKRSKTKASARAIVFASSRKWFRICRAIMSGRSAAW